MKKLLIIVIIIEIINIVLILLFGLKKESCRSFAFQHIDTSYNKVQIDSVQLNITKVESTIVELNKEMNYEMDKANTLNNDSSLLLLRELLQKY